MATIVILCMSDFPGVRLRRNGREALKSKSNARLPGPGESDRGWWSTAFGKNTP
jgi:hypothetical protein